MNDSLHMLITKDGLVKWDKFQKPGNLRVIACPFSGGPCQASCPHIIRKDIDVVLFTCASQPVSYNTKFEYEDDED